MIPVDFGNDKRSSDDNGRCGTGTVAKSKRSASR